MFQMDGNFVKFSIAKRLEALNKVLLGQICLILIFQV